MLYLVYSVRFHINNNKVTTNFGQLLQLICACCFDPYITENKKKIINAGSVILIYTEIHTLGLSWGDKVANGDRQVIYARFMCTHVAMLPYSYCYNSSPRPTSSSQLFSHCNAITSTQSASRVAYVQVKLLASARRGAARQVRHRLYVRLRSRC